jgi:hypothetical protein
VGERSARTAGSFYLALLSGVMVQWLVDPERAPSGRDMAETLRTILARAWRAKKAGDELEHPASTTALVISRPALDPRVTRSLEPARELCAVHQPHTGGAGQPDGLGGEAAGGYEPRLVGGVVDPTREQPVH